MMQQSVSRWCAERLKLSGLMTHVSQRSSHHSKGVDLLYGSSIFSNFIPLERAGSITEDMSLLRLTHTLTLDFGALRVILIG